MKGLLVTIQCLASGACLWDDAVQRVAHVCPDILIDFRTISLELCFAMNLGRKHKYTILIQTQGGARVLDEKIQQSNLVTPDLRQGLQHLVRYQIRSARLRLEGELLLEPGHGCGCDRF
jgi:hypothetical protein